MHIEFTPLHIEIFWSQVERGAPNECWEWAGTTTGGYGIVSLGKRGAQVKAHRMSYTIHNGPIPKGMVIAHTCDNPACVNPEHLRCWTQIQNVEDMDAKGRRRTGHCYGDDHWSRKSPDRVARGERAAKSPLTENDVRWIRRVYIKGHPAYGATGLSRKFGVSNVAITNIVQGKTWRHV